MDYNIYQKIFDARLEPELETILEKLLRYNNSSEVEIIIGQFLGEYSEIRDDFWNQFNKSTTFELAFDIYYQYAKNKCALVDLLMDNLNLTINYVPVRNELSAMMKNALTF